jgi:hypothetical protein
VDSGCLKSIVVELELFLSTLLRAVDPMWSEVGGGVEELFVDVVVVVVKVVRVVKSYQAGAESRLMA